MTELELISELRDAAEVEGPGTMYHLLNEAADRIEELDERVDIVAESAEAMNAHIRHQNATIKMLEVAEWAEFLMLMGAIIVILIMAGR